MSLSSELLHRAKQHLPGGVNSPVRAFNGVGGHPIFIHCGEGAYLTDVDGKHYIDYVGSWGPLILGHNHPSVINAVHTAVESGLSFGAPTEVEVNLADKICHLMPNIEMIRMVNSGTEATMSAIRLARGYTNRDKIIKFAGCYHGHNDSLLVEAGSGALTLGVPGSAGVPKSFTEHTLTATFNDLDSVEALFALYGEQIAALIVEPVAGNMGCIPPVPGFLEGLRHLCDDYGTLLIFDEVMTGFRVNLGGAQALYNIKPDLTTLGKIIGGGMPVGAFGGKRAIMEKIAPLGPVYQAGTLSGNPIAMAAGLATLNELTTPDFYEDIAANTQALVDSLLQVAQEASIPLKANYVGGMFSLFFTKEKEINNYSHVKTCDLDTFKAFFHGMLKQGIYLAPSAFETGFLSCMHLQEEIDLTVDAAERVFATLRQSKKHVK